MPKLLPLFAGAGAALILSACGQVQKTVATQPVSAPVDPVVQAVKARAAEQNANKLAVEAWFKPDITMDERLALMSSDYVQHNPVFSRFAQLNNVSDRDAFKLMFETRSKLRGGGPPSDRSPGDTKGARPPPANRLYKVMVDGDMVTVVHQRYLPDPQHPGKFYEVFGFDTFRMENGKIAEHWDEATIPTKVPVFLTKPVSKIQFSKQTRSVN